MMRPLIARRTDPARATPPCRCLDLRSALKSGVGLVLSCSLAGGVVCGLGGCADRRIRVTSEPPGASVWVNDVSIGKTPAETSFTFYGAYDLRVELDGYEPVSEVRQANAPLYEYPGVDLLAEAVPFQLTDHVDWHVVLSPALEVAADQAADPEAAREAFERDLIERMDATASELDG